MRIFRKEFVKNVPEDYFHYDLFIYNFVYMFNVYDFDDHKIII